MNKRLTLAALATALLIPAAASAGKPDIVMLFQNSGIRIEDWTGVDFETVFPSLLFQGGQFDGFEPNGWDRLCSALA